MNQNWKLIKSEKPKANEKVLIVSEYKGEVRMVTAIYKNNKFMAFSWFTKELEEAEDFTHWKPWPLPPSQQTECSPFHFPTWDGRCMVCGKQVFIREPKNKTK